VIGQAFMIAGTASSISGAGLEAVAPLFVVGAPATIYAAIDRILQHGKEQYFKGEKVELDFLSGFTQETLRKIDPLQVCTDHFRNDVAAFSFLGDTLLEVSDKLSEAKLCSLLFKVINSNKVDKMGVLDNVFFYEQSGSHHLRIKDSGLEDVIVRKVRDIIARDRGDIEKLLDQGMDGLKARMVAKFGVPKSDELDNDDIEEMLSDTKKTLKFLRFAVVDSIVKVSHMVEASKMLQAHHVPENSEKVEKDNSDLDMGDIGIELNGNGNHYPIRIEREYSDSEEEERVVAKKDMAKNVSAQNASAKQFAKPRDLSKYH
jgi:hypothetical protein